MSRGNRFYLRLSHAAACGVRLFAILLFTQCLLAQSNPTVAIDSPVAGAVVAGTMRVFGWAVDNASTIETGISGVPIQIKRADNGSVVFNGGAGYGLALYNLGYTNAYRPDVCNVYPNRVGCPYVGYQSDLDTTGQWGAGQGYFDVSVTATDSDQPVHHSITSTVRPYVEPLAAPTNLPVIPASGSTIQPTQLFTFSASSTNRPPGTDIYPLWVLFNNSVNGTAACYFSLAPSSGAVALVNDAGNAWGPSVAIGYTPNGAIPPISNSQCRLNLGSSWFTIDSITHNVALNMSITFLAPSWQNTTKKAFQLSFQGVTGANTGWQEMGSWTIPAAGETITTPSVSGPTSGSVGTSYTYAASGATSNLGHQVKYQFTWGDGTSSGWLAVGTTSAQKAWTAGGSYSVTVQARCAADTTALSSVSNALLVAIPPGPVTLISPANGATGLSNTPTLSWSASPGATLYDVYVGTTNPPVYLANTANTSYTRSLNAGTTYYWKVIAENAAGSSPASAVWSFATAATPDFTLTTRYLQQVIATGQNIAKIPETITPLNGFSGTVTLSWTNSQSWPAGLTATLSQTAISPPYSPVSISIATTASTPPGTYNLNLQAASGSIMHTQTITLIVNRLSVGANLGPVPFDDYDAVNKPSGNPYAVIPGCSASWTVRACMQSVFQSYKNQGATSIRFFFGLRGGGSTALDVNGNVISTWATKLNELLQDIYNAGITHVIVNPILLDAWGMPKYPEYTVADPCFESPTTVTYEYRPHLPFPYAINEGSIDVPHFGINHAYDCADGNNRNFWGWQYLYNLVDKILETASSNNITVDEIELSGDTTPITNNTVVARLLYDNKRNEPVLQHVQEKMASRMGEASRYHVTFSSPGSDSSALSSDPGADCNSIYGDSARLMDVSEFLAATAGGAVGWPTTILVNRLFCGGNASLLYEIHPQYASPTPAIIDVHTKPTLLDSEGNNLNIDAQGQGTLTFNSMKRMIDGYGPTQPPPPQFWHGYNPTVFTSFTMFGETWRPVNYSYNQYGSPCGSEPPNGDTENYDAYRFSTLAQRPGSLMAPYVNLVGGCYTFPPVISNYQALQ